MAIYYGSGSGGGASNAGRIIQAQLTTKTDHFSSNSDTFTDLTGLNVNITPHDSGNKILIIACIMWGSSADSYASGRLLRGSTPIGEAPSSGQGYRTTCGFSLQDELNNGVNKINTLTYTFLDSPNTTSQVNYKLQGRTYSGDGRYFLINRTYNNSNSSYHHVGASRIMALEVAA